MSSTQNYEIDAIPNLVRFDRDSTALLLIDMQRDFVEAGGFGESLGNEVALLRSAIEPCQTLLKGFRSKGMPVLHTREGHRPNLADLSPEKQRRCAEGRKIGDQGPMGRILVRGEPGHDLIPECAALADEIVIDKPGKGAFFATDLDLLLRSAGIKTLIIGGVTTEVCVHSTAREANDRGYQVIVAADACASYFPEFHRVALEMIAAQGGIFGAVAKSKDIVAALA